MVIVIRKYSILSKNIQNNGIENLQIETSLVRQHQQQRQVEPKGIKRQHNQSPFFNLKEHTKQTTHPKTLQILYTNTNGTLNNNNDNQTNAT